MIVAAYTGAEAIDISGVIAALTLANRRARRLLYDWSIAFPGGGLFTCGTGIRMQADIAMEKVTGPVDTLVVPGGVSYQAAMEDKHLISLIARIGGGAERLVSLCAGAGLLAQAGLVDGRRVATLINEEPFLTQRFRDSSTTFKAGSKWYIDGPVWSAGGTTPAIDMMMSLILRDSGTEIGQGVAALLGIDPERPHVRPAAIGVLADLPKSHDPVVQDVIEHIMADLAADLSTAALARFAGRSERQLVRLFQKDVAMTPGKFVSRARVGAARRVLADTLWPLDRVAKEVGLGTAETLRKHFQGVYGMSPAAYRDTQQGPAPNG